MEGSHQSHQARAPGGRGISNELIGMLAIGVTLAGLMIATWSDVRSEIRFQGTELRMEMRELRRALEGLDARVRTLEIRSGAAEIRVPPSRPAAPPLLEGAASGRAAKGPGP